MNIALHELLGFVIVGAAGKITTLAVLLSKQATGASIPADIDPQADPKTYFAFTV
jgi:hypothetical protein